MELSPALREELLHYHSIAEFEASENDDKAWFHTLCGYQAILDGQPIPEVAREEMRRELLDNEDKYEGDLLLDYQDMLADLGFRKRRASRPRQYPLVRDLDNPDYTIPFGRNRFCGPAALAYLLRTDPDAAAALLRELSGKRRIISTPRRSIFAALERYGFGWHPRHHHRNHKAGVARYHTLLGWLEEETRSPDGEYLVIVTGHCIVVHGDRWFDSHCHLGKPVSNCLWLRKRVVGAWLIQPRVK